MQCVWVSQFLVFLPSMGRSAPIPFQGYQWCRPKLYLVWPLYKSLLGVGTGLQSPHVSSELSITSFAFCLVLCLTWRGRGSIAEFQGKVLAPLPCSTVCGEYCSPFCCLRLQGRWKQESLSHLANTVPEAHSIDTGLRQRSWGSSQHGVLSWWAWYWVSSLKLDLGILAFPQAGPFYVHVAWSWGKDGVGQCFLPKTVFNKTLLIIW